MTIVKRGINCSVERTLPVHVKNKLNKHLLEKKIEKHSSDYNVEVLEMCQVKKYFL